jgi:hypothetical protein
MSVVTITITDPAVLAQLEKADGPIAFKGPDGRTIRWAEAIPAGKLPAGFKSPLSDEEFEERRKQTGGRPLADILADLKRKYGE